MITLLLILVNVIAGARLVQLLLRRHRARRPMAIDDTGRVAIVRPRTQYGVLCRKDLQ